jgi:hypothetical protein
MSCDYLVTEAWLSAAGLLYLISARLLPCCEAEECKKILACRMAAPAISATGARADRIVSWNAGESFENAWGAAWV